jgi:hypothetical protein
MQIRSAAAKSSTIIQVHALMQGASTIPEARLPKHIAAFILCLIGLPGAAQQKPVFSSERISAALTQLDLTFDPASARPEFRAWRSPSYITIGSFS